MVAEEAELEKFSAVHGNIVNCITSLIHVARVTDIVEQKTKLIDVFSISLTPKFPWTGITLFTF